jgi:hypothetical protein
VYKRHFRDVLHILACEQEQRERSGEWDLTPDENEGDEEEEEEEEELEVRPQGGRAEREVGVEEATSCLDGGERKEEEETVHDSVQANAVAGGLDAGGGDMAPCYNGVGAALLHQADEQMRLANADTSADEQQIRDELAKFAVEVHADRAQQELELDQLIRQSREETDALVDEQ